MNSDELSQRTVDFIDIVREQIPENKYKDTEDPKKVKVLKTNPNRGPLTETWITENKIPVMCAYKTVRTKFELWGFQTRVEAWGQKAIRDILLLAHKQVFCWTDEWYEKSYESIVEYERETYAKTNELIKGSLFSIPAINLNNNNDNNNITNKNILKSEADKNIADFD